MENRHYNENEEELYATAQQQLGRGGDIDFTADEDEEEESRYDDSLDSLEAVHGQNLGRPPAGTSANMLIVRN